MVLSLKLVDFLRQLLVSLCAQLDSLLKAIYILFLPLPALMSRQFVLDFPLDAFQVLLFCLMEGIVQITCLSIPACIQSYLGEGHVCWKADSFLREQSFLFIRENKSSCLSLRV